MCIESRRLHSHLLTSAAAGFLFILLLPGAAVADISACFTTYTPPAGTGPVGDSMWKLVPDGEDLVLPLEWADDPTRPDATLILETPAGTMAGSWPAPRDPGETVDLLLDDALAHVATLGFQYVLELEDPDAERAQLAFRVLVECPAGQPCHYRLVEGLTGGPIVVSEALWNALAEARALGLPDLIGYVRDQYPELAAEIPYFVWQMQVSEPKPGSECKCRWLTIYNALPPGPLSLELGDGEPPRYIYGNNYDGANYLVTAQTTFDDLTVGTGQTRGQTILGLQLFCTRSLGGFRNVRYPTAWPSMPFLELKERTIASCPAPCSATIKHSGRILGCADAIATGRYGLWATATSQINAGIDFQAQSMVDGETLAGVDVGDGETLRSREELRESYTAFLTSEGAIATAEADAMLSVDARSQSYIFHSYAYASAAIKFELTFEATASCREVPYHYIAVDRLHSGLHEGGVAVERWEDPP